MLNVNWEKIHSIILSAELESFDLAEIRGRCNLIESVIYELAVLDY